MPVKRPDKSKIPPALSLSSPIVVPKQYVAKQCYGNSYCNDEKNTPQIFTYCLFPKYSPIFSSVLCVSSVMLEGIKACDKCGEQNQ